MGSPTMCRPGVPAACGPCLADQAADGDDRVGEVEVRVDDLLAPLVAALQPVEGVLPGVCPLGVPAFPGLDGSPYLPYGRSGRSCRGGEFLTGLRRVVASV